MSHSESEQLVSLDDVEAGIVNEHSGRVWRDDVRFRNLEPDDLPALQELQRGLFPVRYNDSFYTRLFSQGHYTLVGVTTPRNVESAHGGGTPRQRCSDASTSASEVTHEGPNGAPLGARGEAIVAVASARVTTDWRIAYIMTLGVHESYRRRGLGAQALQLCLEQLRDHTSCMVAQLHVKCLNTAAVAFYNGLGWIADEAEGRGGLCSNHYLIDGVRYDALALKYDIARMRRAIAKNTERASYYTTLFEWGERVCTIL